MPKLRFLHNDDIWQSSAVIPFDLHLRDVTMTVRQLLQTEGAVPSIILVVWEEAGDQNASPPHQIPWDLLLLLLPQPFTFLIVPFIA